MLNTTNRLTTLAACLLALLSVPAQAAPTATRLDIPATASDPGLIAFLYVDNDVASPLGVAEKPALVLMHGCSGMWANSQPYDAAGTVLNGPDRLLSNIRRWAEFYAREGYVVYAVDSFTTRKPASYTISEWQRQCGWPASSGVNEVTQRRGDALRAYAHLATLNEPGGYLPGGTLQYLSVAPNHVSLMGWSHGGTAALAAASAVLPDADTPVPSSERVFRSVFAFYPGCAMTQPSGTAAYGGISRSYWRPYGYTVINHAGTDSLLGHCSTRVTRALAYPEVKNGDGFVSIDEASLNMDVYPYAAHSFDLSSDWGVKAPVTGPGTAADSDARYSSGELIHYVLSWSSETP